jgi:hypothetical protein
MSFEKNTEGINSMFEEEFQSRKQFSKNIREKNDFKENYFNKIEKFLDENENSEPKRDSLWDKIIGKNNK